MPNVTGTLYQRLGGTALAAAVDLFYEKVTADPLLAVYFEHVNLTRLQQMQAAFLAMAFGGPARYTGRDLRSAHAGLTIGDPEFDRVLHQLAATLRELDIADADIAAAIAVAGNARSDVLNHSS